ncbi:hypothetical protein AAY473_031298 [Plecturocebus cupreus]
MRLESGVLGETGFYHVGQAGLKLITSSDPPTLASQSAEITGTRPRPVYTFTVDLQPLDNGLLHSRRGFKVTRAGFEPVEQDSVWESNKRRSAAGRPGPRDLCTPGRGFLPGKQERRQKGVGEERMRLQPAQGGTGRQLVNDDDCRGSSAHPFRKSAQALERGCKSASLPDPECARALFLTQRGSGPACLRLICPRSGPARPPEAANAAPTCALQRLPLRSAAPASPPPAADGPLGVVHALPPTPSPNSISFS